MPIENTICVHRLLCLIGTPGCPAIADVRPDTECGADAGTIPGAFRQAPDDPAGLVARLRGRAAVIVCKQGHSSRAMVRSLLHRGIDAEYLEGGITGWCAAQAPLLRITAVPFDTMGQTCWITGQDAGIGGIACAWLIRRFVDTGARFLFVGNADIGALAGLLGATPFDIADVQFGPCGEACTFEVMLREFHLRSPALDRMAVLLRAVSAGRANDHPVAVGVMAVSVLLSRRHANDQARLSAGMSLCDGLYRWARHDHAAPFAWPGEPA